MKVGIYIHGIKHGIGSEFAIYEEDKDGNKGRLVCIIPMNAESVEDKNYKRADKWATLISQIPDLLDKGILK